MSELCERFNQLAQHRLKGCTVPVIVQFCGAFDTFNSIIGCDLGGFIGGLAPQEGAGKGRGINVTGAMAAIGEMGVFVVCIFSVFQHNHTGLAGGIGNSGEDYIFAAQCLFGGN